ncbi:unnamed protein product [Diplocarpon coronariae]
MYTSLSTSTYLAGGCACIYVEQLVYIPPPSPPRLSTSAFSRLPSQEQEQALARGGGPSWAGLRGVPARKDWPGKQRRESNFRIGKSQDGMREHEPGPGAHVEKQKHGSA